MGRACDLQRGEGFDRKTESSSLGLDGRVILTWMLNEQDVRIWTGFIWLRFRIGTSGRVL